jgi:hypothetical protein
MERIAQARAAHTDHHDHRPHHDHHHLHAAGLCRTQEDIEAKRRVVQGSTKADLPGRVHIQNYNNHNEINPQENHQDQVPTKGLHHSHQQDVQAKRRGTFGRADRPGAVSIPPKKTDAGIGQHPALYYNKTIAKAPGLRHGQQDMEAKKRMATAGGIARTDHSTYMETTRTAPGLRHSQQAMDAKRRLAATGDGGCRAEQPGCFSIPGKPTSSTSHCVAAVKGLRRSQRDIETKLQVTGVLVTHSLAASHQNNPFHAETTAVLRDTQIDIPTNSSPPSLSPVATFSGSPANPGHHGCDTNMEASPPGLQQQLPQQNEDAAELGLSLQDSSYHDQTSRHADDVESVHMLPPASIAPEESTLVGLVEARPVVDDPMINEMMVEAQPVDPQELQEKQVKAKKEQQCRRIGYSLIALCCSILGLAIGFSRNKERKVEARAPINNFTQAPFPTESPTLVATTGLEQLLDRLSNFSNSTVVNILQDASSPQYKAYHWLIGHSNLTAMPEWRKEQRFALATFYWAFQGPSWPESIRYDWMNENDECYWFSSEYGTFDERGRYSQDVSFKMDPCNDDGRFQSLVLANLKLVVNSTPAIPQELALLTSLEISALPMNNISALLSALLPENFASMTSLERVLLHGNALRGSIPDQLTQLVPRLGQQLALAENQIRGTIPTALGLATNLEQLLLGVNQLSGTLPSELGSMKSLKEMFLNDQSLTGTIPSTLGALTALQSLGLQENTLSGSIPTEFGLITNCGGLYLFHTAVTGSLPSE